MLVLQLTSTELNAVKRMASLMMGASSSYVHLASGAVKDAFGNDIQDAVLGGSEYHAEVTAPALGSFSFTLVGDGTRFSIGTLRVTGLTLQDSAGPTSALHSLSGTAGASLNAEGTEASIFLTKTDADTIKALGFCSAVTNCYLTMAGDTITDWVGLYAVGIAQGSGMRTSTFGQDTTPVTMEQFSTFDLNTGILSLSFSEAQALGRLPLPELRTGCKRFLVLGQSSLREFSKDRLQCQHENKQRQSAVSEQNCAAGAHPEGGRGPTAMQSCCVQRRNLVAS